MQTGRRARGLLAFLSAAIGIGCLRAAYLMLGAASLPATAGDAILAAILAICGIVCVLGSLLLWFRLSDRPRVETGKTPRFGRYGAGDEESRSRLVPALVVVALAGAAALATHQFAFLRLIESPSTVAETQEAEEPAPTAPQSPSTAEPAAGPSPGAEAVSPGPAAPVSGEPKPAVTSPASQETAAAPPPAPPPAPETTAPETPPAVTTVPMPEPEAMPTQADGHRDAVVWLSLAPDGRSFLSAGTDRTIKLWDIAGRQLIRTVATHSDMARVAVFLPGGTQIVTAGDDGEIVLRSTADGAPLHVFSTKDHGGVNKIAISGDGRRMVSGHSAGTVLLWDLEKRAALHVERAHGWSVAGVAISDDGKRALSGSIDGDLKLWDVESGTLLRYWGGHERGAYGMAFTRDGKQAVTGSGDRTIKLWDLESGRELKRFEGHSQTIYAIALSADGSRILSGSLDGTARLWDIASGAELALYVGHSGPVYSVAFGPDGTILTGGYDRTIRIWPESGGNALAVLAGSPE
ncbi:MAG: WD40 repeat domain-containing protein [Pseudomonadota bacterium]